MLLWEGQGILKEVRYGAHAPRLARPFLESQIAYIEDVQRLGSELDTRKKKARRDFPGGLRNTLSKYYLQKFLF